MTSSQLLVSEARKQILEQAGRLPDALVACVGGGSNAMGLFYPFLNDASVKCMVLKPLVLVLRLVNTLRL